MMFYDLSKAFDTVNIEILLEKLAAIGILGDNLHWLKSYLTDRSQYTDVNCHLSNRVTTKTGVPQGSVLGPILFLLYINRIKSLALKGVPYLYTYDIAILYSVNKYEELQVKMEDNLHLLTNWTASIKLSINHENTKTELIKTNILLDVRFENVKIDFIDNFKYLGLRTKI
jgi:ribonucleases P/MRP protein subunit RPP40